MLIRNVKNAEEGKQYLTFLLGEERFGLSLLAIQEVIGYQVPKQILKAPDYLLGVLNLRGSVIPILDLRIRFKMSSRDLNDRTCVLILQHHSQDISTQENTTTNVGIVVDKVLDVVRLDSSQLQQAPYYSDFLDTSFITGLGRIQEETVTIIDIGKVLEQSGPALVYAHGHGIKREENIQQIEQR
jgi:purine-binding chemotaxis protein CheW